MKYIYNPITGTLDDVETPNLGEKYFASAETDAIKDMMNEKFGPGTVIPASELPVPENPYKDFEDRNPAANGGMMRQNFVAGAAVAPLLSYPATFGLAKALGIATAGVGATELGNKVTDYLKENPEVMDTPQFRGIALAFGLKIPGVIAPDADEMEREAEKIREMTKPKGFGEGEKPDIPLTIGGSEPPDIEIQKPPVSGTIDIPVTMGGSEIPEQTLKDFIFYNKETDDSLKKIKKSDLKKDFENKKWQDYTIIKGSPAQGTRESIPQKTNIPFFEKLNTYSKQKHAGNLKAAIREIAGLEKTDKKTNLKKKTGDKKFESLYTSILNAAKRSGFKFETTQNRLESDIELSKVPLNFVDFTDRLRDSPTIINNRLKEIKVNKNKVYNRQELQEILGIDTTVSKRSNNFFIQILKDQGLTPIEMAGGKKGFKLNETISALKDYAKNKSRVYESRKYDSSLKKKSSENYELRSKVDGKDFTALNRQINKAMNKTLGKNELYFPDSVAQLGHNPVPVALIERISMLNDKKLSDKIFNIQNYTWQGKEINYEVLAKKSAKLESALKKLNKFYGKTITEKNIGTVEEAIDELRNYYDSAVEGAGEVSKKLPFHKEVVGRLDASVPEIGDKLTADNFSVDMSNVDPRFIIGNVDLLNPNAIKYKDLSKEEKIQYGQSIIDQKIEQLKEFYGPNGADFPPEIIEDLIEQFEFGDAESLGAIERKGLGKASGGVIPDQEIMNYATGGRVNFQDGTPNPQLEGDDFLNELEFKFNNIDSVTLDDTPITFDDSKSSIAQVADLANPKNIPYYADIAVRAGLRVGEFGTRILPATGQLISDLIQKPMFKVKSSYAREDDNEILDYGEVPENNNVKFVGGPIFKNFLKNITPTSTEKLVGLDTLINEEKKKMIERGSSSLPVKVAETAALGGELIAPIFPGLKLLRAYAKSKSLPVNDDTKQLLEEDIDSVLTASGTDRRQFLQMTGASATIVLAKMLGVGDEVATATKVAEKATAEVAKTSGVPPYFFNLVKKIKNMGDETMSTKDKTIAYKYDDYYMEEDFAGNIEITRKGDMDVPGYEEVYMSYKVDEVPIKGEKGSRKVEEYEEYTARPDEDGKMKDVEDGVPDDVIEEGTIFEDNMSDFKKW